MDRLHFRLPWDDRWRCFLLLDGDHQLLGYTMMDSTGSGGQVSGDGAITPTGSVELILEEKSDGNCEITEELLRQVVPETSFFNFEGYAPDLGGDVKAYVAESFHMAWLVTSGGTASGGYLSATWNLSEDHIFTLLLYRDLTTLCGYFVGAPEDLGGGKWRMEITFCDYDFSGLYEQQKNAFSQASLPEYIAPEQVERSGAVWCIDNFYLNNNDDFCQAVQQYGLWSREQSVGKERFCKPVEDLDVLVPSERSDGKTTYAYVLLLDKRYDIVGYTILTN